MSNRSERREAERLTRKLAYQLSRTTPSQLAANQANAQHSTGPATTAGKAASARNHTLHGLTGEPDAENFHVLPCESQSDYDTNLAAFRNEWLPVTATEHDLVNRLSMHQWLRRRALKLQNTLFDPQTSEITDSKKFELYRRYESAHERGFNKALADIQRLRSFQLRQQNGFDSQRRKTEEHAFKIRRLEAQEQQKPTPKLPEIPSPEPKTAAAAECTQ